MSRQPLTMVSYSMVYLRELEHHDEKIMQASRIALYNIGQENTKVARELIKKGPKTGRLYRIKGRKRRHRASAPGQAPANLTGNLRRNVGFEVYGGTQMHFGDRAGYGVFLEMGTYKMKPRPHLITAIHENQTYATQQLGLQPLKELFK